MYIYTVRKKHSIYKGWYYHCFQASTGVLEHIFLRGGIIVIIRLLSGVLEPACICSCDPIVKFSGILGATWHYLENLNMAMGSIYTTEMDKH